MLLFRRSLKQPLEHGEKENKTRYELEDNDKREETEE